MEKNKFFVLKDKFKLEQKETATEKKQPILSYDEEWTIKDWKKPNKVETSNLVQVNILGSQKNTETTLQSKKNDKKVNDETLDVRLRVSNVSNKEQQNNSAKKLFSSVKRFDEYDYKTGELVLKTEDDSTDIPDSIINMLIEKFLNEKFLPTDAGLNIGRNNTAQANGDLKWNMPALVKHRVTKDLNKMLYDKYGNSNVDGKGEDIPVSFYFDLSCSMFEYSRLLSLIAMKLMYNNVKVLFGYNEIIYYQIDEVPETFTMENFESIIKNKMKYSQIKANPKYKGVEIKEVRQNINKYLREKEAKRLVAFTDFDPKSEIEDLSKSCEIWWFCFKEISNDGKISIDNFKGHFYNITQFKEFTQHLKNISNRAYEEKQRKRCEKGGIEIE